MSGGGGSSDPGEADLPAEPREPPPASGTTYQRFVTPESFDLSFADVVFALEAP